MAYSLPSAFTAQSSKRAVERHYIVKISDSDGTDYLFSDQRIEITFESAYGIQPLLLSVSEFGQQIDWQSRMGSRCDVQIELSNAPYAGSRLSDRWGSTKKKLAKGAATVEIYGLCGSVVTAITDCALFFKGKPVDVYEYDEFTLTIRVADIGTASYVVLPHINLTKTYPAEMSKRVPTIFGIHGGAGGAITPLAKTQGRIKATRTGNKRFYLHDGTAGTNGKVWIKSKILNGHFLEVISPTFNTDSNGTYIDIGRKTDVYCYAQPDKRDQSTNAWLTTDEKQHAAAGPTQKVYFPDLDDQDTTDDDLVFDSSADTYGTVKKGSDAGSYKQFTSGADYITTAKAQIKLGFPDILPTNTEMTDDIDDTSVYLGFKVNAPAVTDMTDFLSGSETELAYGPVINVQTGGVCHNASMRASDIFNGSAKLIQLDSDLGWDANVGLRLSTANVCVSFIRFMYNSNTSGYISEPTANFLEAYECYLRIKLAYVFRADDEVWYSGDGVQIGSTISARGSNPGTTVTNEFAPFMIERILRDAMGVATADIDTDSFDAQYASAQKLHLALDGTKLVSAQEVIQEICENGGLAFVWDAAGKARVTGINPSLPGSTNATIWLSDMSALPRVLHTSKEEIFNTMTIDYEYDFEGNEYLDQQLLTDSTSVTDWGTVSVGLQMRLARKATAELTAWKDAIKNLYAQPHEVIEFVTFGWKFAHLQLFDWIDIRSTEMDAQVQFYGASWNGIKFMIDGRWNLEDGIKFRAIRIKA